LFLTSLAIEQEASNQEIGRSIAPSTPLNKRIKRLA